MFPLETKIIVIDDFATMRKIITKILNALGYKNIIEADDGDVAIKMLDEASASGDPVKLIVSDWNMPKMTGIDLLKFCRNNEKYSKLPFLMVTSEIEQKNIIEAAKSGVSDYVGKPFNAETLKGKLEKIWKKHNPT